MATARPRRGRVLTAGLVAIACLWQSEAMPVEPPLPAPPADPDLLVAWARQRARALPWRQTGDPWAILVAETMLQQTTVATVARRFEAFLARWPSPAAMAATSVDEVVGAWAGLGYYARARRLHATATALVERHGGAVPPEPEALCRLPGLGRYTAAAVGALAFGARQVPVDANVARIGARIWALEATGPRLAAAVEARFRPGEDPAAFVSALMDLGQTLCRPRRPDCGSCPWAGGCAARASGRPDDWPRRLPRRPRAEWRGRALILEREGRLALARRPEHGPLGGTWGLPGPAFSSAPLSPPHPGLSRAGPDLVHLFTHVRLTLELWRATPASSAEAEALAGRPLVWRPLAQAGDGLPTLDRRALATAGASRP